MELKIGDKVEYTFPTPANSDSKTVIGKIEFLGENQIHLITEENVKLKISYKNFDLIKLIESDEAA